MNEEKSPDEILSKLVFIAEIRPEGLPGLSSNLIIEKSRIQAMVRSSVRVNGVAGELVLGKVLRSNSEGNKVSLRVDFNSELHSWDYSWKSNRWEVNKTHVIDIIVLEKCSNDSMRVLRNFPSQSFTIFSARHIKTSVDKDSLAISANSVDIRPSVGELGSQRKTPFTSDKYKDVHSAESSTKKMTNSQYAPALSMQLHRSSFLQLYPPKFISIVGYDGNVDVVTANPRSNYTQGSYSDENGSPDSDSRVHYNYSSTTLTSSSDEDGVKRASPLAAKRRRVGSDEGGKPDKPEGNRLLELCGVVEAITRGASLDEGDS